MSFSWRSCLAALCFIPSVSFAQNIGEDEGLISGGGYSRQVGFAMGPSYRTFVDQAFSDILYKRIGAGACLSNQKTDEFKFTETTFQASYLDMRRKADDLTKGTAKSFKGTADYRHAFKIDFLNPNNYDVRVGGIVSILFDYRTAAHLNNSSRSFDYAFSLGAYGKIARTIIWNAREAAVVFDLAIPFIADMGRPGYNNVNGIYDPEYKSFGSIFDNNQFGTFGRFFRLTSRIHAIYPLKNGNKFKFTYQWDYYRMKGLTKVYSAEHTLMVAFMFNY